MYSFHTVSFQVGYIRLQRMENSIQTGSTQHQGQLCDNVHWWRSFSAGKAISSAMSRMPASSAPLCTHSIAFVVTVKHTPLSLLAGKKDWLAMVLRARKTFLETFTSHSTSHCLWKVIAGNEDGIALFWPRWQPLSQNRFLELIIWSSMSEKGVSTIVLPPLLPLRVARAGLVLGAGDPDVIPVRRGFPN